LVGASVGASVGAAVGVSVGAAVGAAVGVCVSQPHTSPTAPLLSLSALQPAWSLDQSYVTLFTHEPSVLPVSDPPALLAPAHQTHKPFVKVDPQLYLAEAHDEQVV
jgi:hypothetical protein